MLLCSVVVCVVCGSCCVVLLCGVSVRCCCAVLLCRLEHWEPEACEPEGATLPRDAAAVRGEGRRGKLDKTTPCGRDILLHRGLAKCVAHLHDFD